MAVLSFLSLAETLKTPGGIPWEWLIVKVFDFVVNYGWRIVLFTVLLKVVLLPLDIYQKHCMRKNQRITERLKPEMEKLQKAYGHDKQAFAQKQMELNKREGFSYFSSCLPAIITLVLFIWLWNSMRLISEFMIFKQYVEWDDRYNLVKSYLSDEDFLNQTDADGNPVYDETERQRISAIVSTAIENYNASREDADKLPAENVRPGMASDWADKPVTVVSSVCQQAVADFYAGAETNRQSFLWVASVWSPDVPWKKPIGDFQSFLSSIGKYATDASRSGLSSADLNRLVASDNYNLVTPRLIAQENRANGYLVLPIFSVGLSLLSYWISQRQQKKAGQAPVDGTGAGAMKFMMVLMPLMMGFFALTYSAAFTLYMVINSATTILVNLLSSFILSLNDLLVERKATATVQKYGRPDPNVSSDKKKKRERGASETGEVQKYGRPDPNAESKQVSDKPSKLPKKLKRR